MQTDMERQHFLKVLGMSILGTAGGALSLKTFASGIKDTEDSETKMPALFLGHGSPMNTIEVNDFTQRLNKLGKEISPRPRAILCISAHWLTKGTFVQAQAHPQMVYDMYGFPAELYKFRYPAPGSPETAKEVKELVKKTEVQLDTEWGYDHGNYSVMTHLYPNADIPVFQLSIDYHKPMEYHYELAQELVALRKKGILIIGSGNITHNLRVNEFGNENAKPYDWAVEFDHTMKTYLDDNNYQGLIDYEKLGKIAKLAHPEPSHYIPLIYSAALREKGDTISYPYDKILYGTFSMRCVKIG